MGVRITVTSESLIIFDIASRWRTPTYSRLCQPISEAEGQAASWIFKSQALGVVGFECDALCKCLTSQWVGVINGDKNGNKKALTTPESDWLHSQHTAVNKQSCWDGFF